MGKHTWLLGIGALHILAALTLIAVSFATEHWLDTVVDRSEIRAEGDSSVQDALSSDPLYFTRYRGIFRTCYPGNETVFLVSAENRVDGWCLSEQGYELSRREETVGWGNDYETRIHLMRSHFALFIIAIILLVLSTVLSGVGCWTNRCSTIRVAGAAGAIGALFAAGGVAVFHGYEYLENNNIFQNGFYANYEDDPDYALLVENSSTSYGYSYILAWVGVGLGFLGAIVLLCTAQEPKSDQMDEKERFNDYTMSNSRHSLSNSRYPRRSRPSEYDNAGYYDDYYDSGYPGPYPYDPYRY